MWTYLWQISWMHQGDKSSMFWMPLSLMVLQIPSQSPSELQLLISEQTGAEICSWICLHKQAAKHRLASVMRRSNYFPDWKRDSPIRTDDAYLEAENLRAMTWAVVSTEGAFHYPHMDTAGVGTISKLLCGKKLWVIHLPRCDRSVCDLDAMYATRWHYHKMADPMREGSRSGGCIIIMQEAGDIV